MILDFKSDTNNFALPKFKIRILIGSIFLNFKIAVIDMTLSKMPKMNMIANSIDKACTYAINGLYISELFIEISFEQLDKFSNEKLSIEKFIFVLNSFKILKI